MTAHDHLSRDKATVLRAQALGIGTPSETRRAFALVDAMWDECDECAARLAGQVAADVGSVLALQRLCAWFSSGDDDRWPIGAPETQMHLECLEATSPATLRALVMTGARVVVRQAQLFAQVEEAMKEARRRRRAPRVPRPGQRSRNRQ